MSQFTDKHGEEVEITQSEGELLLTKDGNDIGELSFVEDEENVYFYHTGVRPQFGGRGLGTLLVEQGLEHAKATGKEAVAICSMVQGYLLKHGDEFEADGGSWRLSSANDNHTMQVLLHEQG